MADSAGAVVTLVHGTWARKNWHRLAPDQRWPLMQAAIAKALEPESVRIDTEFKWSGRNSVNARYEAARSFKKHVQNLDIPDGVPFYIVAHSHGGSVAALALDDESLRRKVTGLVCLSTPFFHVRARDSRMRNEVFWPGLLTIGLLVAWLTSLHPASTVWTFAGMGLGAILVGIVAPIVLSRFGKKVLIKMRLRALADVPVLVVRAPADDTSLPLTAFQFVAWLAQWLYWFVNGTANVIRDVLDIGKGSPSRIRSFLCRLDCGRGCAVGFRLDLELLSFEAAWQIGEKAWKNALSAAFVAIWSSSGLALLAYLLAAGVAAVTSVLVGPELAIAGLYLDASVETAPPGRCDFEQLSMSDAAPSGLQHSTHSNPAAISRVAAWLNTAAQTTPQSSLSTRSMG